MQLRSVYVGQNRGNVLKLALPLFELVPLVPFSVPCMPTPWCTAGGVGATAADAETDAADVAVCPVDVSECGGAPAVAAPPAVDVLPAMLIRSCSALCADGWRRQIENEQHIGL